MWNYVSFAYYSSVTVQSHSYPQQIAEHWIICVLLWHRKTHTDTQLVHIHTHTSVYRPLTLNKYLSRSMLIHLRNEMLHPFCIFQITK